MKNKLGILTGEPPLSTYSNSNKALSDFRSKYSDIKLKFVGYNLKWSETENKYKKSQAEKYSGNKLGTIKQFDWFMTTFDKNGKPRVRDHVCLEFNIKDTNIAMIDFDSTHHTLEWIYENYPFLKDHKPFPGNSVGYHFFVQNDANLKMKKLLNLDNKKIDYITDSIWIPIYQYEEYISYKPKFISDNQLDLISQIILKSKYKSMIDILPIDIQQKIFNINNEEVAELVDILHPKRSENGFDWSKVIAALKSLNLYDIAYKFSSKCFEKHDDIEFDSKWSSSNQLSIGIIYNFAKNDNKDEYFKIINKYKFKDLDFIPDDFDSCDVLAKKICPFLEPRLKYSGQKWYSYNDENNLWEIQENALLPITNILTNGKNNTVNKLNQRSLNNQDKEVQKIIDITIISIIKSRREWDSASKCSQVEKILKNLLKVDDFHQKLNSTPYQIPFKNGIFNAKDMTFREGILASDFVFSTVPYDYDTNLINQESIDSIHEDLNKIFALYDHKKYCMRFIGYSMLGIPHIEQIFRYHYGRAGNGKSQLTNILMKIFPNLVKKVESKLFLKNCDKKHKFVQSFQSHKLCIIEEVPNGILNTDLIKELCDGNTTEAELMYGQSITYKINAKFIMNSNNLLNADRMDGGVERRLEVIKFKNRFVDSEDEIDLAIKKGAVKAYVKDSEMANRWENNYMSVFTMLMSYANDYNNEGLGPVPEDFLEEKQMIIDANNGFECWLYDNIIEGPDFCEPKNNIISKYKAYTGATITDKELLNIMKDSKFKYNKEKKKNKCKGCYIGFQLKEEDIEEEFINDPDNLDL